MNVVHFSNHFVESRGHGIARYAHELSTSVEAADPTINVRRVISRRAGHPSHKNGRPPLELIRLPWGRELTTASWLALGGPPIERWVGDDIDLVHCLALGYPVQTRKPLVVTVHDIGPLTHPEYFPRMTNWVMKTGIRQLQYRADAVVCVSKATADELQNYLDGAGDLGERIHVVHEGVSPHFFGVPQENQNGVFAETDLSGTPFFLAVGVANPRKNLDRVLKAFDRIAGSFPHHLVLVGGSMPSHRDGGSDTRMGRYSERIHTYEHVTEYQLAWLYRRAAALVYVSLHEGFGLPILEAMASGCPVVASRIEPLVEIGGDAALFVEPRDIDEIVAAMELFASDSSQTRRFRDRGQLRSNGFSWAKCSEQTIGVYRRVNRGESSIRG